MNVLAIQGLSKAFGGQRIIDDLNMAVPEGSVFGFIGQNGAGRTTTMKMVLGLLRPDQGEVWVCDEPTSALDPVGRKEILDILRKISGAATVLFSTHILSDVERVCDRAALLSRGKPS